MPTQSEEFNIECSKFSLRNDIDNALNTFAQQINPQMKASKGFLASPIQLIALVYVTRALIYIGDTIIFLAITIRRK